MSKSRTLRVLVTARLTAAAEDICALLERTIADYEEELCRSEEENQRKQRLLDSALTRSPAAVQLRAASALSEPRSRHVTRTASLTVVSGTGGEDGVIDVMPLCPAGARGPSVTAPDVIKEEQSVTQDEQLQVLASESSGVCVKTEESSQLQQRLPEHKDTQDEEPHVQTHGDTKLSSDTDGDEDWRAPFGCSAAQMETEADGGRYVQVQVRARSTAAQNPGADLYLEDRPETSVNMDASGTAEGRKTHQCSLCNKRFARNRNLQIHLRLHSGERPHSCSFCNKTFAQIGALNYHLVTHTGQIPLSCPVCKKGFRISSHLKAHMTTHTGEKPYSCSFCKKAFSQKAHLTVHWRTHTGEKPFRCSLCDRSFARMDGLRSHVATHVDAHGATQTHTDAHNAGHSTFGLWTDTSTHSL
ncbi:uncharacterized protein [Eucyclogobius newberryi]|uniref:uncharacterized protein n=1 Tax=Eucyclogobius newberryi TaxID=166745 RepID=UPI003B5B6565